MSAAAAPLHRFDEVDSTQHTARALALDGCPHGTTVVARAQTAGRGRQGRAWMNVPDALLCSVVLRPQLPVRLATRLPLAVCARLLDAIAAPLFAKWPNDLLVAGAPDAPRLGPYRKVGGILVEAVEAGDTLLSCVVGIGINVRGAPPAELVGFAGTLADAGYAGDVEALLNAVRGAVPTAVAGMTDAGFGAVRAQLTARSATLGRAVDIDRVQGIASGIDDDGALLVTRDDGVRVAVRAGDAWLRAHP